MNLIFLWVDGKLEYSSALAMGHFGLLHRLMDKDKIEHIPINFAGGFFNTDTGNITLNQSSGLHPNENEFRIMLEQDLDHYSPERYQYTPFRQGATVEDTDPEFNLSFLDDPHKELYPPVWKDDKMIPEAKDKIKAHVMNVIEKDKFKDADQWIYFTVFGSGASYNWDEDGDFDVQMWVDIDKYNQVHGDAPMVAADLLSEIRSLVQTVNFPSFKDIGLTAPDAEEGSEGSMLIQYYPQLGTGSEDENLAKKPYACYDMETDEWLQHPKPYSSDFYGTHFLAIQTKANDIAEQAEQLIDDLQRNILSFQFWSGLYNKYHTEAYLDTAGKSQDAADLQKEGIATLFEGVFGGRRDAYSPTGQGIEDERDAIQKLLEVWGIFQKLKHYARAPLPWDEQEMPEEPKESEKKEAAVYGELEQAGTFGFVNGNLIIARTHHQAIMASLINQGWTWEQLMAAQQAWGWYYEINFGTNSRLELKFSSDSGFQNVNAIKKTIKAFQTLTKLPVTQMGQLTRGVNTDIRGQEYGQGLHGREFAEKYAPSGEYYNATQTFVPTDLPKPQSSFEKWSVVWEQNYYKEQGLPSSGPFGFIGGQLILGEDIRHHQIIMAKLLHEGWTWEQLFSAPQAWGWMSVQKVNPKGIKVPKNLDWQAEKKYLYPRINLEFASDAGIQTEIDECVRKFTELYHAPCEVGGGKKEVQSEEQYGSGLAGKHNIDYYLANPYLMDEINVPGPPKDGVGTPYVPKPLPPKPHIGDKVEIVADTNDYGYVGETGEVRDHDSDDPQYEFLVQLDNHDGDAYWFSASDLAKIEPEPVPLLPKVKKAPKKTPAIPGGGTPPPKKVISPVIEIGSRFTDHIDTYEVTAINSLGYTCKNLSSGNLTTFSKDGFSAWFANGSIKMAQALQKFADWNDLMEKARRLKNNGQVQITVNEPDHVVGTVQGDHDTYNTEIWRDDPASQAITMWDCGCKWDQYSWGRTRQWKKYEGRPCSHTLALFWQAQSQQPQGQEAPQQTPPTPVPGGGMVQNQGLLSPVPQAPLISPLPMQPQPQPEPAMAGPPAMAAPPAMSQITTPQNAQGTIALPGAFSHTKISRFKNGEKVRCKYDIQGTDTVTNQLYRVPQNTSGEVLYSDDTETVVIFPLAGSYHSPHLIKVEGLTYEFYSDPNVNPFIKRKGFLEIQEADPFEEADVEYLDSVTL